MNYVYAEIYLIFLKHHAEAVFEEEAKKLLFSAAKTQHWEIVASLIADIDCSVRDETGKTALHYLSHLSMQDEQEHIRPILEALIKGGCPILGSDDPDDINTPPLLVAVEDCNLEMLAIFLDNINDEDKDKALRQIELVLSEGHSILKYDKKKLEILKFIVSKNVYPTPGSELFFTMLSRSQWNLLSFLNSKTHLHSSLFYNLFDYAEQECKDFFNTSNLFSCLSNIVPHIEIFFSQADPQIELDHTHNGTTPLHQCIAFFEKRLPEMLSLPQEAIKKIEWEESNQLNHECNEFGKSRFDDRTIPLLQDSYLACVKFLATQANLELADSKGHIPINLIKDMKSPVYQYLTELQQQPKKRRKIDN